MSDGSKHFDQRPLSEDRFHICTGGGGREGVLPTAKEHFNDSWIIKRKRAPDGCRCGGLWLEGRRILNVLFIDKIWGEKLSGAQAASR